MMSESKEQHIDHQGTHKNKLCKSSKLNQIISKLPPSGILVSQNGNWMIKMHKKWNKNTVSNQIETITKELFQSSKCCSFSHKFSTIWSQEIDELGEPFWISQNNLDSVYGTHVSLGKYKKRKPKHWYHGLRVTIDFTDADIEIWQSAPVREESRVPFSNNHQQCKKCGKMYYQTGYVVLTNFTIIHPTHFDHGNKVTLNFQKGQKQMHLTLVAFGVKFMDVTKPKEPQIMNEGQMNALQQQFTQLDFTQNEHDINDRFQLTI
eukprot:385558_1